MSMEISVQITGDTQLIAKFKRLGVDLKDYTSVMKDIGQALSKYYSGPAFLSMGGVFGAKWPSLSPSYQIYKANHFRTFANSILVRGAGTDSMQNEFEYVATKDAVVIGNRAPYFKYHQSSLPRTKIPRRQMMGVNSEVRSTVVKLLQADINKKLSKA